MKTVLWELFHECKVRFIIRTVEVKPRTVAVLDSWTRPDDRALLSAAPLLLKFAESFVHAPPACAANPQLPAGWTPAKTGISSCDCWSCECVAEARAAIKAAREVKEGAK